MEDGAVGVVPNDGVKVLLVGLVRRPGRDTSLVRHERDWADVSGHFDVRPRHEKQGGHTFATKFRA